MITAEKIVYDIRRVLKEFNLGAGSISDSYLYQKINNYAELIKKVEYAKTKRIDPTWMVNLGKVPTENVNSGNDPNINGSVMFSFYRIPKLIMFGSSPYIRVSTGLRTNDFTLLTSFDMFYRIYNADRDLLERFPVYILTDSGVYTYPNRMSINIMLAPADPFECSVMKALTNPITGAVISDGTILRTFTIWDSYPISGDQAQQLIVEYISKEFQVTRQEVEDFTQNGTKES